MGRLAHELGHKLGGHGAKHCDFDPSVMRGESSGGRRFINFVYPIDVELANQALMFPGSCTGVDSDGELEEPFESIASRRIDGDDFDQLLRKGSDLRRNSTQHSGFAGLGATAISSSASVIVLLVVALFVSPGCGGSKPTSKDPSAGSGHLSRVAAQAKSRGENQTTLKELVVRDTSSTLDEVLSQAGLLIGTPTRVVQSVTADSIFTWQYFAVSDWLRHFKPNNTADDCSGPPPPVPTPDGQVVARLAKGRATVDGIDISELSEAEIEFGQKRYLLFVQECPGGYVLRPWGKDSVFEISANDELSLASFNSSSVRWQRDLLDLGTVSALRKHLGVSR